MEEAVKQVLEMVAQPAFLAREGAVCWRNEAAGDLVFEGMPLDPLMEDGGALFSMWNRHGILQVSLILRDGKYSAAVSPGDGGDLFVVRPEHGDRKLPENLAGASASMRRLLQTMMGAARELFDELEEEELPGTSAAAAQLNQSLYQMMRFCIQMSDSGALLCRNRAAHREPTRMQEFFDGLAENMAPLLRAADRVFTYRGLKAPVSADVDRELLERAVYNLISNAIRYTKAGDRISLELRKEQNTILAEIRDSGEGIAPHVMATLFDRSEAPGGDARRGLGLGLPFVREVVRLHEGTLAVSANEEGSGTTVRFTLSLHHAPLSLHSRRLRYDYCGSFSHGLIELSDVLPWESYDPREVL